MRIEYLYNKANDQSTFFVWVGMELVDKLIYPGEMSLEEIKATKERIQLKEKNEDTKKV